MTTDPIVRIWDMGDPEPPEGVIGVVSMCEIFDDEDDGRMVFGRTKQFGWKSYLNGKIYLDWPEVVRRFGPVHEYR